MSGLLVALVLLSVVGAFDTIYFHIVTLRLYARPECRWEVLTHAGHGFSAALIFALCAVDARGPWAWLYVVAAVAQGLNQTIDTVLEPKSRRAMGGLPDGEYVTHGVINCLWGAVLVLMLVDGHHRLAEPAAIAWRLPDWPFGLAALSYCGAAVSLAFGLFDLIGFLRLGRVQLIAREPLESRSFSARASVSAGAADGPSGGLAD